MTSNVASRKLHKASSRFLLLAVFVSIVVVIVVVVVVVVVTAIYCSHQLWKMKVVISRLKQPSATKDVAPLASQSLVIRTVITTTTTNIKESIPQVACTNIVIIYICQCCLYIIASVFFLSSRCLSSFPSSFSYAWASGAIPTNSWQLDG